MKRLGLVAVLAVGAALFVSAQARAAGLDARLLRTYQPVTVFDPLEPFRPTGVQSFLVDSQLEQYDGSQWLVVDRHPWLSRLPGPGTGVWRLNQMPCSPSSTLGGLFCYRISWLIGSGPSVVYGHVVRLAERTVLQYWYFYYDDVYSYTYPASDLIWQAHEGDWEVVNVVLGADGQPLQAAYSQHCSGSVRSWADTPLVGGTHPLVYVAWGSHSNYFSPGTHPIRTECIPPQALQILTAYNLPLPVDYAGQGAVLGPPRLGGRVTTIVNTDDWMAMRWLAFPGFWGEYQYFHLVVPNLPPVGTVASGTSPVGPAYHAVWQDPLGTLSSWPAG